MKRILQWLGRTTFLLSLPVVRLLIGRGPVRTRVFVVTDGEVLLIKDWFGSGQWSVPGGGLHRGEAAIDGAVRELREEVGITTTAEQLRLLTPKLVRVKTGRVEFDCMAYQLRLKVKPVIHRQWYEIAETQWRPLADLGGNQADGGLTSLLEALGGTDSLLH